MTTGNELSHISAYAMTIGPKEAEGMLKSSLYDRQRKVNKDRVSVLSEYMVKDRFLHNTNIHILRFQGNSYLVDGQHRLHAVVKSGKSIRFIVKDETTNDEDYVGRCYSFIDIGQPRNDRDMYKAFGLSDKLQLTDKEVDKLGQSVRWIANGMTRSKKITLDKIEKVQVIDTYTPYMQEYLALCHQVERRFFDTLMRSYAVAMAVVMYRYKPTGKTRNGFTPNVDDFWRGVIFDDGLSADDPRKRVHRHFRETIMVNKTDFTPTHERINHEYGAKFIELMFKAYLDHRVITKVRIPKESNPINIPGVPHYSEWLKP